MADKKDNQELHKKFATDLLEILKTVREMETKKAQQEQAAQVQQDMNARQSEVGELNSSMVFASWDLDSAGNKVAQAENTDDPEKVAEVSQKIEAAQNTAKDWIARHNGRMVQSGGDEGCAQISSDLIAELEEMRAAMKKASGFTCTIGVGEKISQATRARMLGKVLGKNQIKVWDETTDKELEMRLAAEGEKTEGQKVGEALGKSEEKKTKWSKPNLAEEYETERGFFGVWPDENHVEVPTKEGFIEGALKHGRVETIPHHEIDKRLSEYHSPQDKWAAKRITGMKEAFSQGAELPMPVAFQTQKPDSNYHHQFMVFGGRHRIGAAKDAGRDVQVFVIPYPEQGQELYSPAVKPMKKSEPAELKQELKKAPKWGKPA